MIIFDFDIQNFLIFVTDIKVKEPTEESLTKKIKVYMEPRFMSVSQACQQLLEIIKSKTENKGSLRNI